jgi:LysR family glycine cleavage system transcriptional activator
MTSAPRIILPSTTALKVFEAAARHLTCTGAADELFLTQGAVSKQIRTLEECLGITLFVRINRGLVLTELGRIYLNEIRPVLAALRAAAVKINSHSISQRTLTLRISATLGDRWLLPRFGRFVEKHPHINVQFTGFLSRDKQDQIEPDGEFRGGEGNWPGFVTDYLFGRPLVLVAAPSLLQRHRPIEKAEDILGFPKLMHYQAPTVWAEFCESLGFELPETGAVSRCEFYSTLIRGAVSGLGLAVVPRVWVQEELSRGELINPLALNYHYRVGYYFIVPERKQHDPALAAMRAWLIEEAAQTRQECKEELPDALPEEAPAVGVR